MYVTATLWAVKIYVESIHMHNGSLKLGNMLRGELHMRVDNCAQWARCQT